MNSGLITTYIIVISAAIWLLWEGHCTFNSVGNDTFSEVLRALNYKSGGLLALLYFSMGIHFFFNNYLPKGWF